uniref:26S proteasome regulatory subunit RPN2 C-terminal domain-containing protein n=1 Tax=Corethron hystrix TaxID=216773 RepID=A0A7S1FUA1_9STRA
MYGLGLAYCGTGSEVAVRQLLHAAVSDVNDDVRMAAVISLALVLYRTPRRVPQLVKLLLESFHPHVRYASCIAVGIALAATGDAEALNMLEPMLTDMSDFVRQGGIIATALVLMQQSEANKKTKWFREKLVSIISDKHQSTLTKMGAVMATGILDAGGRNMSISLGSSTTGFTRMTTAVGLVLWLQQWHWYPMMHMFSLALTPTVTIGLNKDFNVPKCFGITCNAKPSLYAYPKKLEEKKEEKKKRIETVALSTTAKSKAREARKKAKDGESSMEIDEEPTPSQEDPEPDAEAAETVEGAEAAAEDRKSRRKDPEPAFHRLANPCRITAPQSAVCAFDLNQRYRPVRPEGRPQGIVMLTDTTPAEEEDVDTMELPSLDDGEGQEVEAPEPFEWAPPEATTEGENTALASEGGGGETKDGEEPSSADSMEVDDKK